MEELNEEATIAIGQAAPYKECNDLVSIVKLRLERMYNMLPPGQSPTFPEDSTASSFEAASREKLSPITGSKLRALDDPSKASLTEYDKTMASAEQSLVKATQLLTKTFTELQVASERERAKEERLRQIRSKRAEDALKSIKAARAAGKTAAEAECANDANASDAEEDVSSSGSGSGAGSDHEGEGESDPGGEGKDGKGEAGEDCQTRATRTTTATSRDEESARAAVDEDVSRLVLVLGGMGEYNKMM